jgi:histidine ammonia-lyase
MAGAEALRVVGLAPVALAAKDGLGLLAQGSVSAGRSAIVLEQVSATLVMGAAAAALAFEGYAANPRILDRRLHELGSLGQPEAAAYLRAMLADSFVNRANAARKIQDALSFRVIGPILGTQLAALAAARHETERRINVSSTTPLVLVEDREILSSPNFHSLALALAFDTLAIALAHAASASAFRIAKLMTGALADLPRYLSPVGGGSAGYVSLQKTAAALYAEIRSKTTPVTLDALPVSDTVEDVASFAFLAIQKVEEQLTPLRWLTAIEALAAAQAVDLRATRPLGRGTSCLYDHIRATVPRLDHDREPGLDVAAVERVLADLGTLEALRAAAGPLPVLPAAVAGSWSSSRA